MCRKATKQTLAVVSALVLCAALAESAQNAGGLPLEWRHIGNSGLDLALPAVATGPIARVWYSPDGTRLLAQTAAGRIFETTDFERWNAVRDPAVTPPERADAPVQTLPVARARVRQAPGSPGVVYGFSNQAYRSDDGGATWLNLTEYRGSSVVGNPVSDLAVSPREPLDVTIANRFGLWRSVDGGLSWTGLNQGLPNLPIWRILGVPVGTRGVRVALENGSSAQVEWAPGEKTAWRPIESSQSLESEFALRSGLSQSLGAVVTAVSVSGDYIYAGGANGRLWASSDQGRTWQSRFTQNDEGGPVQAIYVDPQDPRLALAALGARPSVLPAQFRAAHVRRTVNGGAFWDDLTANLPDVSVRGITADRPSGAVYVATEAGLFFTVADLTAAAPPTAWTGIGQNLPQAPVADVRLDSAGNQLFVAVEGYGVYAGIAPHRFRDARVVSSGDYSNRPAAPGAVLSVLGARVESAHSASASVPVLATSETTSQIQLPFEVRGPSVSLTLQAVTGQLVRTVPLVSASPAIFVDPDGTPLILDADSGVLLDAMNPAHSGSRIQILATGLGRVKPDWQAGMAAPLYDPPRVVAPVRALLDRAPVEVTQAVLAPGYIGLYLIEVQLPRIVNAGPAELYIDADGQPSNRVRLYIQP